MDTNLLLEAKTKELAQNSHKEKELFDPAAVFEKDGRFYMGRIREMGTPPHDTFKAMKELGLLMVSHCDSLLGVWKDYKPREALNNY